MKDRATYNLDNIKPSEGGILLIEGIDSNEYDIIGKVQGNFHTVHLRGRSKKLYLMAWHFAIMNNIQVLIRGIMVAKYLPMLPLRNVKCEFVLVGEIHDQFIMSDCCKLAVVGNFDKHTNKFSCATVDFLDLIAATGQVSIRQFAQVSKLRIKSGDLSSIVLSDLDHVGVKHLIIILAVNEAYPVGLMDEAHGIQILELQMGSRSFVFDVLRIGGTFRLKQRIDQDV